MRDPQLTARPALWAVRLGTPVALAAVAALACESQYALGRAVGWGPAVAWLLPVAVIVCELVATLTYFQSPAGSARTSAGKVAMGAIAMSYGLSSTWHVLHPESAPLLVTLAVSAVPNLVAALMLHIAMSAPYPAAEAAEVEVLPPSLDALPGPELPAEVPDTAPALPASRKPARPRKTSSAKADALALLRKLPEDDLPSASELAAEFRRTDRWARDVLAEFRQLQAA